nr:hypothetical protein [Psychrobacter lutiphocae]
MTNYKIYKTKLLKLQAAQEAINLLIQSKDKEGLQAKLGEADGIVVPEVTGTAQVTA